MQEAHLQHHNFYYILNVSSRRTLKGKNPSGLVCIASRPHENAFKTKGLILFILKCICLSLLVNTENNKTALFCQKDLHL